MCCDSVGGGVSTLVSALSNLAVRLKTDRADERCLDGRQRFAVLDLRLAQGVFEREIAPEGTSASFSVSTQ